MPRKKSDMLSQIVGLVKSPAVIGLLSVLTFLVVVYQQHLANGETLRRHGRLLTALVRSEMLRSGALPSGPLGKEEQEAMAQILEEAE